MTISGRLPLNLISTNGGTQSRGAIIDGVINDYMELLDVLPPVVVFHDGEAYWLADGFHRLRAFEQAGQHDIPAEIRQGTRRDAILFSVGANAEHGLRRTRADKQRAVLTLLHDAEWSAWSDSEIARRCHVSHTMVATLRSSIAVPLGVKSSVTCKVASERTYKTKRGTTATMKTAGIGGNRQRDPKPGRDRPHQEVVAPVQHIEPSKLQHDPAPDWHQEGMLAIATLKRLLGDAPGAADRAWLKFLIGQLIPHVVDTSEAEHIDPDTGEITTITNCEEGQAASDGTASGAASSQPEPAPRRSRGAAAEQAGDWAEAPAVAPSSGEGIAVSSPQPISPSAVPLADEGLDASSRSASGPDLSQDPVPLAVPVEDVAAASACGEGTPATSSNLSAGATPSASQSWADSHEVKSAPEMPDFLRRTS